MQKTINKTFALLFSFMFLFVMFVFSACDRAPNAGKDATDDGSLEYEASCNTDMQYTMDDFYAMIDGRSMQSFSHYDGFRFTYVLFENDDEGINVKQINGITTDAGMNFRVVEYNNNTTFLDEIVTIKQQNIYVCKNLTSYQTEVEKTFRPLTESKLVVLKNYLYDLGFEKFITSPKDLFDELDDENLTFSVGKHNQIFELNARLDGNILFTIYVNFDDQNNLSAIKYQTTGLREQVTLSGFNGEIQFPNLDEYVLDS